MVERRLLTPQFVFAAKPPDKGERWISDTKIRGFGLRLWATKSGGAKAFAIRVSDPHGRHVRRTYDAKKNWRLRFAITYSGFENALGLGDSLESAREWARNEIDGIKGRATLSQEEHVRWRKVGAAVRKLPLGRAALSLLEGMRVRGLSEAYIDRLDKLFATNVPDRLKRSPLGSIKPKAVANALVNKSVPPANIRVLRSFIGQIFERGASFNGPLGRFRDELSIEFWKTWEKRLDVRFPELRNLNKDDYKVIFAEFQTEDARWQQAYCIRLFFEFGASLTRLMSARWAQILDEFWYPYDPEEKVLWFESRERITPVAQSVLDDARERALHTFPNTIYWFPSAFGRNVKHIRSVEAFWRTTLEKCGSRYYPLREFALSYRRASNPSYLISFLRQYGETFREVSNVAEVSKKLLHQKMNEQFQ